MTDKKKASKKPVKKTKENSITDQLTTALAMYKDLLSEKRFVHIVKKTSKQIEDGIAKAEKKKKKNKVVEKKPVVKKKSVPKKNTVKKTTPKKIKTK
ncbi:MAG: hypothetical protein V4556_14070 [Bacteroidota bacterium]